MLRETKIGLLVACSFLGLVGTVFTMKYKGDPLAAELSAASSPDPSAWLEPKPVESDNPTPIPQPAPAPGPSLASAPAAPGLQPLSNPNEIKLVSAPGSQPAPPQPIDHVTAPPQAVEAPPVVPPSVPAGPPMPVDSPAVSAGTANQDPLPTKTTDAAPPPSAPSGGPLTMPAPDKVIDRPGNKPPTPISPATDAAAPAVAALAGTAAPPNPALSPTPSAPAATLGLPAVTPGPAANNAAEIKPSPIPSAPPVSAALVAATPPPAANIAAVSPPIRVPTPAASVLLVPQVASFDEETYQCRPGDTMKSIAQQHYHSDKYEQALLRYNRDYPLATDNIRNDPASLPPGQPVYVPQVKVLESRYPSLIPGLTPLPQPAVAVATPPAPPRAYRVGAPAGEMMRDIAGRTLSNPERWVDILRLNPGYDPARPVPAGAMLQMPPDAKP